MTFPRELLSKYRVRDRDGKVVGVQIGKETLAKLANEIAQNTEQEVIPRLRVERCSGTLRILAALEKAGLPKPEFKEAFAGFQVVFYRDLLTEERLGELGLNERKVRAVLYVEEKGSITNREYREMFGVSKETAKRDLKELVDAGIFEKIGKTGRSDTS